MSLFRKSTGVYRSRFSDVIIPEGISLDEFMFEYDPPSNTDYAVPVQVKRTEKAGAVWVIDAKSGRTLTYEGCVARTHDIARGLHTRFGLGEDDVMAIYSGNEVDYPTAMWAAFRLGAIVSAANPSYMPSELSYQLELVNKHHPVKVLLTHPDSLATALASVEKSTHLKKDCIVLIKAPDESSSPEVRALCQGIPTLDDIVAKAGPNLPPRKKISADKAKTKLAFLSFSSGTTGLPKAVMISHYNVISNVLQMTHQMNSTVPFKRYDSKTGKGDVAMGCLPFFHIYGLVVVLHGSIFMNCPVVTVSPFSFPAFLEAIQRWKISLLYIVPPIVIQLIKMDTSMYDLSSLRFGMSGAAPLSEETSAAFAKKFPGVMVGQGYGMTETCTIVSIFDSSVAKLIDGKSAGVLSPNVRAKIVSPEGKLLPPGEVGELLTQSPSNALGYLGNKKATDETFDSENFVHTGDECYISREGWLYVVDRIKELIKVKGNQVAPAELEGLVLEHPDVLDCCIIGIPDDRAGERPKAYVALAPAALKRIATLGDAEATKIQASIKKLVSDVKISYKHISVVEFIDAIPKTASGKLLRKDLRVRHAASMKAKAAKL